MIRGSNFVVFHVYLVGSRSGRRVARGKTTAMGLCVEVNLNVTLFARNSCTEQALSQKSFETLVGADQPSLFSCFFVLLPASQVVPQSLKLYVSVFIPKDFDI